MPNIVIKDSESCWNFDGGSLCNVEIHDKATNKDILASFIMNGNIKGIKSVNNCWKDENGNIVCSVNTKGKDGGKNMPARAVFHHHIDTPLPQHVIHNARTSPKCDPKTDPFCRVR
jgi:hypothetical protein